MADGLVKDSDGKAFVRDKQGNTFKVSADRAASLVAQGEYEAASLEQVTQRTQERMTSTGGALARGAAAGVVGGALALPKAVSAVGSAALGTEDPLAPLSGRQFVEDVQAVGSELLGGPNAEMAGRQAREQLEADIAVHPIATTAGEIGGQLIGGAAYGAGALKAGGALAAGLGATGRTAQVISGVAGGALEGGALGATQASEEAWIRDTTATAEQTLAGMGLGALFGAGLGGAIPLAKPALQRVFGRGKGAADEAAETIGQRAATLGDEAASPYRKAALVDDAVPEAGALERVSPKAQSRSEKWLSQLSDDAAIAAVARQDQRAMRELGGPVGDVAKSRRMGRVLKETGIVRGASGPSEMLERASKVAESSGQEVGSIIARVQKKGGFVEGKELFGRIDEHIGKFRGGFTPEMDRIADNLEETVAKVRERAGMGILEQSDLHQFRRELDKSIKWSATARNPATDSLKQLRGIVEDGIEKEVSRIGKETGDTKLLAEYGRAKEIYRASRWAEETLSRRAAVRDPANRFFSLTDQGAGLGAGIAAVSTFGPVGAAAGLASAFANKMARERGASLVSDIASKLARESVDVGTAPIHAQGTARALRTVMGNADERATDGIRGLFSHFDEPDRFRGRARRASTAAALQLRSDDRSERRAAYQKHAQEIARLGVMPELAAERLGSITGRELPSVAPGLHTQMAMVATRATQYLQEHMPAPAHDPDTLTPHLDEVPPVSDAELEEYATRVEGVLEPLSLLEDMADGDVDPVKVEAVKTVWPRVFQGIQAKVFTELTQRKEPVPPEARKLLDIVLDANGTIEPSLAPRFMQTMQAAGKTQEQPTPSPPANVGKPIASAFATRTERIATGAT